MFQPPRPAARRRRLIVSLLSMVVLAQLLLGAGLALQGRFDAEVASAADPVGGPGPLGNGDVAPGALAPDAVARDGVPAAGSGSTAGGRLPRPALPDWCHGWPGALARADLLLAGKYQLDAHPAVSLGFDPTWAEDPLADRNWQFVFQSQYAVLSLLEAWVLRGDRRYYDRAEFLLRDWYEDNSQVNPPSDWSWNDHSTALRAVVYACAAPFFPNRPWLVAALDLHGRTLADPTFYIDVGNHALNASIGLLEVGAVLGREDWRLLASRRIAALIRTSVDAQGATNEQSIAYEYYNLSRYRLAEERLRALRLPIPAEFSRLDLMSKFLAHATLPNGHLEEIGDTGDARTPLMSGTWAEFARSQGASGPRPTTNYQLYRTGYLFARSGWGETRPFADEVFTSLRFGPAPYLHGHADGSAVTFYGYGSRLLVDPGRYSYNYSPFRTWITGRTAHNVVTVDGLKWSKSAATRMVGDRETPTMIDATLRMAGYAGVWQRRRMTFSRNLNYLLIEDRATATRPRTFRQLWHLDETADPIVSTNSFRTTHARGNLLVQQLIPVASSRAVTGRSMPIQGWVSYSYGVRIPAPVVEVVTTGKSVRYLTLLVPAAGTPSASVSGLVLTPTGYSVTITIGGHAERVVVNAANASITTLK